MKHLTTRLLALAMLLQLASLVKANGIVESPNPNDVVAEEMSRVVADACDPEYNDYTVRLIFCNESESTQGGRLEIFYRDSWGTVCGNTFTNEAAQVACHSLGYARARAIYLYETYGPADHLQIILADVNCAGTETHLDRCTHRHWADPNHGCTHDQDVSVACDPHPATNVMGYKAQLANMSVSGLTYSGRLEILYNETWGTVCDAWFQDKDAGVACRTIYRSGNFVGRVLAGRPFGPGEKTQPIWLGAVNCTGNELNLGSCPHPAWGKNTCSHLDDVSISCTLQTTPRGDQQTSINRDDKPNVSRMARRK